MYSCILRLVNEIHHFWWWDHKTNIACSYPVMVRFIASGVFHILLLIVHLMWFIQANDFVKSISWFSDSWDMPNSQQVTLPVRWSSSASSVLFSAIPTLQMVMNTCYHNNSRLMPLVSTSPPLDLHLDVYFSWHSHIEAIASKAMKHLYIKAIKCARVHHAQLLHIYLGSC